MATYSVNNITIDNELHFSANFTDGYFLQVDAEGVTHWVAAAPNGTSGTSGAAGADGDRYHTTSNTSLTIASNGTASLITNDLYLDYSIAQSIIISHDINNHMHGSVVSYNQSTGELVFDLKSKTGSGTYTSWDINLDGAVGQAGTSGTSGVNGENGTSGIDGTSGTSGHNGTSGINGTSGSSGTSGVNGTSGSSGIDGTNGINGTDGTSGSSGSSGTSGLDGTSGSSGSSGSSGHNGTSGTDGFNGINGSSGTSGVSGTSGSSGQSGTSGTSGTSGIDGTSGLDGTSGSSGLTGTNGTSGSGSFGFATYSISGAYTQNLASASIISLSLSNDVVYDYTSATTSTPYFFMVDAGTHSFKLGTQSNYKIPSTQTQIGYGATGINGLFKMSGIYDGINMNIDYIKDYQNSYTPASITYLFDQSGAGGAYLAYSTRLLSSTYSGNCMEVRRSSDSATQNIGFVDGLLDTASLTTFLSGSTGSVVTWYDQTGSGRNAVGNIAEPFIAISGTIQTKNSIPSIYFSGSGSGESFKFNNATLAQPSTVFMLAQSNATTSDHFMDGPSRQLIGNVPDFCIYAGGGLVNTGITVTTFNLMTAIFNGASSLIQTNNSTSASGDAGSAGLSVDHLIMSEYGGGSSTTYGFVSEFIVYPSDMTSNLTTVRTNINEYFTVY